MGSEEDGFELLGVVDEGALLVGREDEGREDGRELEGIDDGNELLGILEDG